MNFNLGLQIQIEQLKPNKFVKIKFCNGKIVQILMQSIKKSLVFWF